MSGNLVHNQSVEWQVLAGNRQKWPATSSILPIFHCFDCREWMNHFQIVEYQLVVHEHIHIQLFLVHMTGKNGQISSKLLKISKNRQKITEVPNFDVLLAMYKNFGGMKTVCDRENTTRWKEYGKTKKIVGGTRAALKSAQNFAINGKIPWVHDFWFS